MFGLNSVQSPPGIPQTPPFNAEAQGGMSNVEKLFQSAGRAEMTRPVQEEESLESVLADFPEPRSLPGPADASQRGPGLGVFTNMNHLEPRPQAGKGHPSTAQYPPQGAAYPAGTSLSVADLLAPPSTEAVRPDLKSLLQSPLQERAKPDEGPGHEEMNPLAGHFRPHGLDGLGLQGHSAALALHARTLSEAVQLAFARGDRAGYEAAARAYADHAAWSAYVENQERLAAHAAAYQQALHQNFEAAQAHALYAEAARLEGLPPGMDQHSQWAMGAAGAEAASAATAQAQLEALNSLKRHGDAGDRLLGADKAMLGGREDAMELLQSILPNTRINVAHGPGSASAASAALQGLRGRGYGLPGTNPHGVGLGDPRLNSVLGALNPLGTLQPDLAAAYAAATKPPAPQTGGWAPSLRPSGLSSAEELRHAQGLAESHRQMQPLQPGMTNAGFGAAGDQGCSGQRNQKGGQDRHKGKGRHKG